MSFKQMKINTYLVNQNVSKLKLRLESSSKFDGFENLRLRSDGFYETHSTHANYAMGVLETVQRGTHR